MLVPNRHGSSNSYRYGFQGQEKDDELKGEGNSLNYTFRMHDPRVGRFFAVDPLTRSYPHYTPYSFSGNKVIAFTELEGLEEVKALLLRKDSFSYFQFDIDTQEGKAFHATKSENILAVINNNEEKIIDKVSIYSNVDASNSDKIVKNFKNGYRAPSFLLKMFKEEVLGADSEISKGLTEMQNILAQNESTKEYAALTVGVTADVIKKVYSDLESGKADLFYNSAPDVIKYIDNKDGQKENTLFTDGHVFTITYGKGVQESFSFQITVYETQKTATEILKEKEGIAKQKQKASEVTPAKAMNKIFGGKE